MVSNIVESKEIGTRLFNGIAVCLQCIRIGTWQQLPATVSQTLMQVSMQVVTFITIFLNDCQRLLINDKLLLEAITVSSLVVSLRNIRDGDALRTMLCTYPVGIGQINADSRRGILVTTQHSSTDSIGRNTLDMRFSETGIYW